MYRTPIERRICEILCDKTIQEKQILSTKNYKQTLVEKWQPDASKDPTTKGSPGSS